MFAMALRAARHGTDTADDVCGLGRRLVIRVAMPGVKLAVAERPTGTVGVMRAALLITGVASLFAEFAA